MRSSWLPLIAASAALLLAAPIWSDTPGRHPAYLHALSDLRDARAHLEHLAGEVADMQEEHAIAEIDKAVGEIKQASIMDGKNIDYHEPVDTNLSRPGRIHKAIELLDSAQRDASGEEDQPDTMGLQARVLHHIDLARQSSVHALETLEHH